MKQQHFEALYDDQWKRFEKVLNEKHPDQAFAKQFRTVCHHYALAKKRRYSAYLIDRLNQLVVSGHQKLYTNTSQSPHLAINFFLTDFPRMLRRNHKYVLASTLLFLVPGMVAFLGCFFGDNFVYSLMPIDNVKSMEAMYDPSTQGDIGNRTSESDVYMFGFYIKNNISIAFRTFAGGILFGLGSIFFLVFNGLMIGGVAGHLTQLSYTSTFYPFVIGHGAFELTAIVFSGAAGLKIGFALIAPGVYSRLDALQNAAKQSAVIMIGSTVMLVIAAFIEAFWSSSQSLGENLRYIVGGFFWLLVFLYCFYAGKQK